ncbi:hypothetical protein DFH27DRAFT_345249 [Peziza echinospora]|nr:hypothetical protein DFH27DRAFT_345249 [Peziza echinospora]
MKGMNERVERGGGGGGCCVGARMGWVCNVWAEGWRLRGGSGEVVGGCGRLGGLVGLQLQARRQAGSAGSRLASFFRNPQLPGLSGYFARCRFFFLFFAHFLAVPCPSAGACDVRSRDAHSWGRGGSRPSGHFRVVRAGARGRSEGGVRRRGGEGGCWGTKGEWRARAGVSARTRAADKSVKLTLWVYEDQRCENSNGLPTAIPAVGVSVVERAGVHSVLARLLRTGRGTSSLETEVPALAGRQNRLVPRDASSPRVAPGARLQDGGQRWLVSVAQRRGAGGCGGVQRAVSLSIRQAGKSIGKQSRYSRYSNLGEWNTQMKCVDRGCLQIPKFEVRKGAAETARLRGASVAECTLLPTGNWGRGRAVLLGLWRWALQPGHLPGCFGEGGELGGGCGNGMEAKRASRPLY